MCYLCFDPKQATAFLIDTMLKTSIELSIKKFVDHEPPFPRLEAKSELKSKLEKLTTCQKEVAACSYFAKIRQFNISTLINHFSEYTKLADHLELYSKSPEGIRDGCNPSQTEQHRETKMKAIRGFEEALKEGFKKATILKFLEIDVKTTVTKMLSLANVDKDGNSEAGQLTTEEVTNRICKIGLDLKLNYLYKKESPFLMTKSEPEMKVNFYKLAIEFAAKTTPIEVTATTPRAASPSSQQEALDQEDHFLP